MLKHPRTVDAEEWQLSKTINTRHKRLHDVPSPVDLLRNVLEESMAAAKDGTIALQWQKSDDRSDHFRVVAQIPLNQETFDQFFNGRSGYRAQYYLSPEEGILYNRDAIDGLIPVIREAYNKNTLPVDFILIQHSLEMPHAKIWVFQEKQAFDEAIADTLNPARWIASGATRGRKVPLPQHLKLDLKGAFINPDTKNLFIDDLKLDRACDLFNKGFT